MRARQAEVSRPQRAWSPAPFAQAFAVWFGPRRAWSDLRLWRGCPDELRPRLRRALGLRHVYRVIEGAGYRFYGRVWWRKGGCGESVTAEQAYGRVKRAFQAASFAQLTRAS